VGTYIHATRVLKSGKTQSHIQTLEGEKKHKKGGGGG